MLFNKCNNIKSFMIIIIIVIIINIKQFINSSISQCESLDAELCLAAYPNCLPLLLKSCCPGQTGICTDMDNVAYYAANKKHTTQGCLKNIQTGAIYELFGEIHEMPGYEFFPIPNMTCKDLGCQNKGLECLLTPVAECESSTNLLNSPCCIPEPVCSKSSKLLLANVSYGDGNCDASCDAGFNCRYIGDKQQCIPSRCDLITCPDGTECLPLDGLDIVSCFKTIVPMNSDRTCETVDCPPEFKCGKGVFSNADCVPLNIDLVGKSFDCSICPKDWKCDKFGWGGLCIEWRPFSPGDGIPCEGGICLFNQFCNTTSQQCEFQNCDEKTCDKQMSCIQYQPTHPRVCASTNIIPFSSVPDSIIPFVNRFNDDSIK